MPKVYVTNEPVARTTNGFSRVFDLSPASKFGELVFLTPAGHPPHDPAQTLPLLEAKLRDFKHSDYLLAIGHPALIGWATAYAARASGGEVCMLVWLPHQRCYQPVRAQLWDPGDAP